MRLHREHRTRVRPRRRALLAVAAKGLALAAGGGLLPRPAGAQAAGHYPAQPVRLIVHAPPGGESDAVARLLAEGLKTQLNGTVLVENRPGAGVGLASAHVARSAPDGYTLMMGGSGLSASPAVLKTASDPVRDFTPISLVLSLAFYLFVRADSPIRTLADLVRAGGASEFNYGSSGTGSITHFQMELLKTMARFQAMHIPYKGTAPALTALLAGDIQALFAGAPGLPFVQSGKLRMLAVAMPARMPEWPDVPAIVEAYPGYDAIGWTGVVGPAGMPQALVARIHQAVAAAVAEPAFAARVKAMGGQAASSTPQALGERLKAETARFTALGAAAGIVPQ